MSKNKETDNSEFWDLDTADKLIPFFSWDKIEEQRFVFEHSVYETPIKIISTKFGESNYIEVKANDKLVLLKVDSKRLRVAIRKALENNKKYPVTLLIKRTGSGFNTNYSVTRV